MISRTFLKVFQSESEKTRLLFPTNLNKASIRNLIKAEPLVPVDLSYATYENTKVAGTASPLIIMHGLFGSKSNWNSLAKAINQNCNPARKIIVVDARNHGDSPHTDEHSYAHLAIDIKHLLQNLGIKKACLLGHSMGGRTVMLFALKYPEMVDKLIVADISPVTTSPNLDSMPSLFAAMESIDLPVNMTMIQARQFVDKQLVNAVQDKALRSFLLTNLVERSKGKNMFVTYGKFFPHWKLINVLIRNLKAALQPVQLSHTIYENPKASENSSYPLVIMHGLFGSKSNWTNIAIKMNQKCNPFRKIIVIDARNHGESPHSKEHSYHHLVIDIKYLLDKLSIKKAALLGHSMGGGTVMLFSLKYPEAVDRIIVGDISPVNVSSKLKQIPALLTFIMSIELPKNVSLPEARRFVDEQLIGAVEDKNARAFILTNLVEVKKGMFNWRVNIPVLLSNFNNIARFPYVNNLYFDGSVLFLAGAKSDYVGTLSFTLGHKPYGKDKKPAKEPEAVDLAYASFESSQSVGEHSSAPLVIMHCLMGSKSNWNAFGKVYHQYTSPKRKVYAIDARNHGDSPHSRQHTYDHLVLDMKQFMEKQDLKKVCLLGHSMGGRAAMLFSLKYPELVEKLIVADVSPISTSLGFKAITAFLNILKKIKLPKDVTLSAAKMAVNRQLATLIPNRNVRNLFLMNLVQAPDGSYTWRINITALMENYEYITSFPDLHNANFIGPSLFIGGSKSDFIQKSDFPKIQKLFPKAELKFIDGAGHWLHSDKPADFLRLTLEFLNRN